MRLSPPAQLQSGHERISKEIGNMVLVSRRCGARDPDVPIIAWTIPVGCGTLLRRGTSATVDCLHFPRLRPADLAAQAWTATPIPPMVRRLLELVDALVSQPGCR